VALVGTAAQPASDPFLETAVAPARRSVPRPAARPQSRTTVSRSQVPPRLLELPGARLYFA